MLMTVIYLIAITAEAMSGALSAGRRNMDIFGVAVIAFVTALGGGTVRDVILGRFPVGWTQHPEYVGLVVFAGLVTMLLAPQMHKLRRVFLLLDAMGLVAFSLIGCDVALRMGYALPVVVMAGMITGICGGVLRDVLCNEIPQAFNDHRPYALCAFVGGWADIGLRQLEAPAWLTLLACVVVTAGLRGLALWRNWQLPIWRV